MPTSAMQAFSELGDRLLATTTAIRGWAISASCWRSVGCPAVERLGGGGRGELRVPGATLVVSVTLRLVTCVVLVAGRLWRDWMTQRAPDPSADRGLVARSEPRGDSRQVILTIGPSVEPAELHAKVHVVLEKPSISVINASGETGRHLLGPIEITPDPRAVTGTVAADARFEV